MSTRAGEWQQGSGCGLPCADPGLPISSSPFEPVDFIAAENEAKDAAALSAEASSPTAAGAALSTEKIWKWVSRACGHVLSRIEVRRASQRRRSLRVLETVGMGDKRFVAVVQVQGARFLIGGGSGGVSLLARLDAEQEFADILDEQAAAAPECASAPKATAAPTAGSIQVVR